VPMEYAIVLTLNITSFDNIAVIDSRIERLPGVAGKESKIDRRRR